GEDQGVDLGEARVGVPERLVETLQGDPRLVHRTVRNTDLAGDVIGLRIGQPGLRVDADLVDELGRLLGDLLDVHAAFARRHQGDFLGTPIDHDPDVEFLADVGAFLDQQA